MRKLPFVDVHLTAASTILGITYGYTPHDVNDEFIQLAHDTTFETFRYGGPGSSICDLIPFCTSLIFLHAWFESNKEGSEILADVDATFVPSETCRLHQDACGEAFQSTTRVDRNPDGMRLGYLADLADPAILRLMEHIKAWRAVSLGE